jgi:TolB-like protein/ankyrin repeat protein
LAEFEHASEAVSAALSFQANQLIYNDQLVDDLQPVIRVGIAMGEVVIADNTVTGAGVVQAQRVEQLADQGGVCITAAIHEALSKRLPIDLENLGEQVLKGFDHPVSVYKVRSRSGETIPPPEKRIQHEVSPKTRSLFVAAMVIILVVGGGATYWFKSRVPQVEVASVERMAFPLPDKPSIAVLPFTNISNDVEQDYFADGMTEDLITDLSKVSGLFVIARNSVFTYKGKAVKIRQVAEELGVRYVMEGSVRRVGDQVRINAQLIDATTGGHLWADRYDGSMSDIFSLQDNITRQIVSALESNLVPGETAARSKTVSTRAYDAFLKGWAHYQRRTLKDLTKAKPYLEQAIQLDDDYAQAHAALAAIYWEIWSNGWAEHFNISLPDAMGKAKQHVKLGLKEATPLAHWVASNIEISEGNYQKAVSEAEQVVALDSNNPAGYVTLANALELSGKSDEGAELIDKAVRLDPYYSPLHTAAKIGDTDTVKQLIADGVSMATKDYYGKTALHVATETGNEKIAALLIDAGADIEARTRISSRDFVDYGSTPLLLTAHWGQTGVAELLIRSGADVNALYGPFDFRSVLLYAIFQGQEAVAELLIANGADINFASDITLETPLLAASIGGHESTAELLISNGANVNATDANAATPLYFAAASGDYDIVRLLLANGAEVNMKAARGNVAVETPLHATAFSGHTQIAELLLASGADIDATDQYGYTPLRHAVDKRQLALSELLIKKGADIATRDKFGITPLHVVAPSNRIAIAELLISGGADINAKDNSSGFTPLDYAQEGDEGMIEMLERHGGTCTIC